MSLFDSIRTCPNGTIMVLYHLFGFSIENVPFVLRYHSGTSSIMNPAHVIIRCRLTINAIKGNCKCNILNLPKKDEKISKERLAEWIY